MIGKVCWWDGVRGFGFIEPINGDADVFVHHTGLDFGEPGHRNLIRDAIVEFETAFHDGRIVARDVRPMEDEKTNAQSDICQS